MNILTRLETVGLLALALSGTVLLGAEPNTSPAGQGAQSEGLQVGDAAPDFELVDQNRETVRLSQFRGQKNVVLAFYVLAFTGG